MTELELIIDLHVGAERQGPGSEAETLKALDLTSLPSERPLKVADLGCGTGAPTLTLARELEGQITAVDLFPEFLDVLMERAKAEGLAGKIHPLAQSMEEAPFAAESLDLIWSEGAIYNVGFERGIQLWRPFLKVGGYLAASELTWTTGTRPAEIEDYWTQAYLEVGTAGEKIQELERHGYALTGYFYLSPDSWLQGYYEPLEARLDDFVARHGQAELAQKVASDHRSEIEWYRRYGEYFSYGFYVGRRDA